MITGQEKKRPRHPAQAQVMLANARDVNVLAPSQVYHLLCIKCITRKPDPSIELYVYSNLVADLYCKPCRLALKRETLEGAPAGSADVRLDLLSVEVLCTTVTVFSITLSRNASARSVLLCMAESAFVACPVSTF